MRLPGYLKLQGHCPPVKAGPFSTQPTPNQPSVPRLCGLLSCNIKKKHVHLFSFLWNSTPIHTPENLINQQPTSPSLFLRRLQKRSAGTKQ